MCKTVGASRRNKAGVCGTELQMTPIVASTTLLERGRRLAKASKELMMLGHSQRSLTLERQLQYYSK